MNYISKNYKKDHLYSGIHGYHAHHGAAFNAPKGYSTAKGRIGVELEVEFVNRLAAEEFKSAKSNWFYLERDSSIGSYATEGIEIITIPLRPQDAKSPDFWWEGLTRHISQDARSWDTDGRCGLHVHIGNERLGRHPETIIENRAKLIYFHEHFLKDHPVTKVVYGRARSYSERDGRTESGAEAVMKSAQLMKDRAMQNALKDATLCPSNRSIRYHAINITNGRTTEFRLGKGTLSPKRIAAVVEWCDLQCKYAVGTNWGQMSVEHFLGLVRVEGSDNLKEFVREWLGE